LPGTCAYEGELNMSRKFPGNPRVYLYIAAGTAIYFCVWLYGGFALIQYLWSGKTWLLDWKPAIGALLAVFLYARYAYRWMMRADAQWGSGSGWQLTEQRVKLPELRT
jgi:hypothetical protein